jgi:hypothetical protein
VTQPVVPGSGPGAGGRRRTLFVAAGVLAVAAVGGVGYLLLDRDAAAPQAGPTLQTSPRPTVSSPTVSPLSPIATPSTARGLNARNPFMGDPTTTTTTTVTGSEATTGTTGTGGGGTGGGGTATSTTGSATGTATATTGTPGAGPVYVTVLSVGATKPRYTAVFLVNGVRYTQDVGSGFGVPVTFSYDSTTMVDGKRCARFAYGDEEHTLCPGEQINVA